MPSLLRGPVSHKWRTVVRIFLAPRVSRVCVASSTRCCCSCSAITPNFDPFNSNSAISRPRSAYVGLPERCQDVIRDGSQGSCTVFRSSVSTSRARSYSVSIPLCAAFFRKSTTSPSTIEPDQRRFHNHRADQDRFGVRLPFSQGYYEDLRMLRDQSPRQTPGKGGAPHPALNGRSARSARRTRRSWEGRGGAGQ